MRTVTIEITGPLEPEASAKQMTGRFLQAWNTGEYQGEYRGFETPELLFKRLTPKRLEILHKMQGAGEMSLRELARRVERDVKGVHTDVHVLLELGLIEKTSDEKIVCPFEEIRFDFVLKAAA